MSEVMHWTIETWTSGCQEQQEYQIPSSLDLITYINDCIKPICYILSLPFRRQGKKVEAGTPPPDLMDKQISLVPPVIMDTAPLGKNFGDVINDVRPSYKQVCNNVDL